VPLFHFSLHPATFLFLSLFLTLFPVFPSFLFFPPSEGRDREKDEKSEIKLGAERKGANELMYCHH